jgi:hypothetical protein
MTKIEKKGSVEKFYECTEKIASIIEEYYSGEIDKIEDMSEINEFLENYTSSHKVQRQEDNEILAVDSMFDLTPKTFEQTGKHLIHITIPTNGQQPLRGEKLDQLNYELKKADVLCVRVKRSGGLTICKEDNEKKSQFYFRYQSPYFGNGKTYRSNIRNKSTLDDVMKCFNNAIHLTLDKHHVFLEGVCYAGTDSTGVHCFDFITGS